MKHFAKNYNQVKDSPSASWSTMTFLLLGIVAVVFLFNLNLSIFWAEAVGSTIKGEGHLGFIPKWVDTPLNLTTATISLNPTVVYTGSSSTLTWSSTNATSCTGTNFSTSGVTPNATSGSLSVSPVSATTYTVTCDGVSSSASNTIITVKKKPSFIEN